MEEGAPGAKPMMMAPLFRILDERSSGVEKVALIWRMEALLASGGRPMV